MRSLFVLLLMAMPVFATDPVAPPKPAPTPVVAAFKVEVPTLTPTAKLVYVKLVNLPTDAIFVWDITPEDAADVEVRPDGLTLVAPEGTYKIKVRAISGKTVSTSTATFSIGKPTPPPPPTPEDEATIFKKAIQAAYKADVGPDKAATVAKLSSLYKMAATTTVLDPTVKTYGDLFTDMTAAGKVLIPVSGQLPEVRKAIGAKLGKTLEPASGPIDRVLAAKELKAVADALAAVK